MGGSRTIRALLAATLSVTAFAGGAARAEGAACAPAKAEAGEWRRYGGDLANTRNQPLGTKISPATVGGLGVAWTFSTDGRGTMQNTPVVADGCVYLATSTGWVIALNADSGEEVWATQVPGKPAGSLLGGVITGSPVVQDGMIYVGVSELHNPKVVALRQADGVIAWTVPVLDDAKRPEPGKSYDNTVVAAPVVVGDVLFQGIMGSESGPIARGGYALVDLRPGLEESERLLVQDWTITDAEYGAGYRGASIWCTGAGDETTGHVYACGGNPASKQQEARFSNALLKIDVGRTSPTFGQIVDSYKGDVDQYYPGLDRQPVCDTYPTDIVWSPTCAQLDLDFGASPSLFTDELGRPLLGDLQKSGVYHTVYADHMERAWTTVVSAPCFACNSASPAVDPAASGEGRVFTATTGSQMWGLSKDRGRYRWTAPMGTGTHFQSVSSSRGVVFTVSNTGELHAFDADTGLILMRRPLSADVGAYAGDLSSQGVSIARDMVYAASGQFVVALG